MALGVPYEALVIFRDFRWIPFAYAVCAPTWEEFRSKRIAWRPPMSDACWVGPRCRHVYSGAVPGLAGAFSAADLLALDDCLPNGIAYVEQVLFSTAAAGSPPHPACTCFCSGRRGSRVPPAPAGRASHEGGGSAP